MTWLRRVTTQRALAVALLWAASPSAAIASSLFLPGGEAVHVGVPIPIDHLHKSTFVSIVFKYQQISDPTPLLYAWAVTNGRYLDGRASRYDKNPRYLRSGAWVSVPPELTISSQQHALKLEVALPLFKKGEVSIAGGVFGTGGDPKAKLEMKYVSGTNREIKGLELGLPNLDDALKEWVARFNEETGQNFYFQEVKDEYLRDLRFPQSYDSDLPRQFDELVERIVVRGVCECFEAGTPVATRDGDRPIERLKVGDLVWARGNSGGAVLKRVLRTFADPPKRIVLVELRRGFTAETLRTTEDHPFHVPDRGWVPAGKLEPGMLLTTRGGERVTVRSRRLSREHEPVFNLEVEDLHTYFMGSAGVLVHNLCRPTAPLRSRSSRAWSATRSVGATDLGPASAVLGAVATGMIGYALGGEYGAMGAGFVYSTAVGKLMAGRAMSWGISGLQSGVGLLAGLATDHILQGAGYDSGFVRTAANIGVGSVVAAGFAGYVAIQQGATLGAAVSAAGWGALSTGLYGTLVAGGMYHAGQYAELIEANRQALAGDPHMEEAMNEISFGGKWNSWSPLTWYAYGAATTWNSSKSWVASWF